ncbi:hypothetical protein GDO81_028759 [Engystomops pustulosus]|uniref:Sam68 tyrosine-rich domain-containing protein n=1 Tax=Engystomops pustulosus TaxID=76066 RepID=A0AAV6Z2K7_ENGPU|nr:hypothetical protein GDO81_028813 [Engystomops pustulosus]KAG8541535.1 hypothetical protein GDO81_028759 [Engystomops pustulosus]
MSCFCICIKGYDDGFGEDYDDQSYEDYENNYTTQPQSVPEYYDYEHGTNEDNYNNYGKIDTSFCTVHLFLILLA